MKLALRLAIACAALAALALPALATGQGGSPTLTEAQDSEFPDRVWLYRTPTATQLNNLDVTENGGPVSGLSVDSGSKSSGAVLLIDASNSMAGEPIEAAMAAARAFMAQRKDELPVAVIAYNRDVTVLTDFTTDSDELSAAVAEAPQTTEGTRIYDALIEAARLAEEAGYARTTAVLLSDGHRRFVQASREDTIAALNDANVRVISVGLQSPEYNAETLRSVANATNGTYVESATPGAARAHLHRDRTAALERVRRQLPLGPPAERQGDGHGGGPGLAPATATYTTPPLDFTPQGTFETTWVDEVITSPWLMIFVVVSILALIAFAIFSAIDVRNRSLRRRMSAYVTVPSEEESRLRRAEVAAMLADTAQRTVGDQRWWQRFEPDVELGGFKLSPLAIIGWTIVGGILTSLVVAAWQQSLWGLLAGLAAPFVTRFIVSRRVSKMRRAFEEQLADNLDVLAGAMRTGHSTMGALSVMVDSAIEPSKSEFRRVLQDEQLGVPIDDALMVMARRMESYDAEQIALVMRLQREAGGNTAEVLDRVAEVIRGRMELRRLVDVLTAQARISRWILTAPPIFVLLALIFTRRRLSRADDEHAGRQDRARRRSGHGPDRVVLDQANLEDWTCEMGLELIAIAGVLLLGAGVMILVSSLGKARGSSATIDQIQTYGYVAETTGGSEAESTARRPLDSIAGRLGDWAARRTGRFGEEKIREKLISAGMYGTTPRKVLGYQVLCAIAFSLLVLWLVPAGGGSIIFAVVLAVAAGAGGWYAPVYYVELKRRKRMELIDKQMPDMIDLLVVTIEAGLGILASMRVASESMSDPLGQELRLTLQEQRMGLSVGQAIESLGRRADAPNMRIFVRAITQGERLGVSIGTTMRNLSLEMRKRRRAMAEERAQKMPIKMLFPLIFFIFPALFIVILTPMMINIVDALG